MAWAIAQKSYERLKFHLNLPDYPPTQDCFFKRTKIHYLLITSERLRDMGIYADRSVNIPASVWLCSTTI